MTRIAKYFLQSLIIYLVFIISRIVGLKISRKVFASFFSFFGPLFKPSITIENNLKIFSPQISDFDSIKIKKSMWENYGKTFIEYAFLNRFRKNNNHVNIKNEEELSKVLIDKKPVIFISGHFANFELMSMEITKKKIKLATIYRPLNNFFLNPFMVYLRKKYICPHQIKKGINGVRESIEFIKNQHSIALMIDQRVSEGEKIKLFNKTALTTTLPAQLSIKFNLDIIPVYIERDTQNNFRIEFQNKINPKNFENKIALTNELNKVLEKMINRNPGQWIWTHNRWK